MRRRTGFTLIEMIAVLGIIAVILSLLLPALLWGNEAARRIQCINNLKQIHLALQSYQGTFEVYPPGVVDDARPFSESAATYRMGWAASLLPFAEQQGVYGAINFSLGATDSGNSTARRITMSTLRCPDADPRGNWAAASWGLLGTAPAQPAAWEMGRTSYAAVHHDVEKAIDVDDHGVFFLNSRLRAADVSDGLSQTLFFGEVAYPTAAGWFLGGRSSLRNTGSPINGVDVAALGDAGRSEAWLASPRTPAALEEGIADGTLVAPPGYVGGFSSNHRGDGAVFAFGDGSVRFLRASIAPAVYRALGHRSDGEEIDDDAY
ncbi:DUF1559 domain-containing protein [Planctomyces sp. SH-PL62]|uniref:DUF1559 family PulG-like putative transporter n=1 Tax=Planctomyces sp. SH-PL62 TaxID=1636152 RepID=UPI00078EB4F3|nr:DUF1559 domain-containing protein [Planctomyces sp. SH-PL62]AMV39808.1 Type II secretion system protein G precursor [Planctomyces sp. SH-PL62]